MARYVLMPRSRSISPEFRQRIFGHPGVEIIDETRGKALLVEATDAAAMGLRELLSDWIVNPEMEYPRPVPPNERIPKPSSSSDHAVHEHSSHSKSRQEHTQVMDQAADQEPQSEPGGDPTP